MATEDLAKADGGYTSRKFWLAVGTVGIILVSACVCGLWPALIPLYGEMVGGFLAVLALYTTGNVSSKWVIGKTNPAVSFAGEAWQDKAVAKVASNVADKVAPKAAAEEGET